MEVDQGAMTDLQPGEESKWQTSGCNKKSTMRENMASPVASDSFAKSMLEKAVSHNFFKLTATWCDALWLARRMGLQSSLPR